MDFAREYIERHAKHRRSGDEDIRILNSSPHKERTGKRPHVLWSSDGERRKRRTSPRRDAREFLDEIADRASIMANGTLALVRKMFNFAIEHDWLEANRCQMIKRLAPERLSDRVLS